RGGGGGGQGSGRRGRGGGGRGGAGGGGRGRGGGGRGGGAGGGGRGRCGGRGGRSSGGRGALTGSVTEEPVTDGGDVAAAVERRSQVGGLGARVHVVGRATLHDDDIDHVGTAVGDLHVGPV